MSCSLASFTTAIPCRIVHDAKRKTASLEIPKLEPYRKLLDRVRHFDKHNLPTFSAAEDIGPEISLKDIIGFLETTDGIHFLQTRLYEGQEVVRKQVRDE